MKTMPKILPEITSTMLEGFYPTETAFFLFLFFAKGTNTIGVVYLGNAFISLCLMMGSLFGKGYLFGRRCLLQIKGDALSIIILENKIKNGVH